MSLIDELIHAQTVSGQNETAEKLLLSPSDPDHLVNGLIFCKDRKTKYRFAIAILQCAEASPFCMINVMQKVPSLLKDALFCFLEMNPSDLALDQLVLAVPGVGPKVAEHRKAKVAPVARKLAA